MVTGIVLSWSGHTTIIVFINLSLHYYQMSIYFASNVLFSPHKSRISYEVRLIGLISFLASCCICFHRTGIVRFSIGENILRSPYIYWM